MATRKRLHMTRRMMQFPNRPSRTGQSKEPFRLSLWTEGQRNGHSPTYLHTVRTSKTSLSISVKRDDNQGVKRMKTGVLFRTDERLRPCGWVGTVGGADASAENKRPGNGWQKEKAPSGLSPKGRDCGWGGYLPSTDGNRRNCLENGTNREASVGGSLSTVHRYGCRRR